MSTLKSSLFGFKAKYDFMFNFNYIQPKSQKTKLKLRVKFTISYMLDNVLVNNINRPSVAAAVLQTAL